jgi:hypothetical protein
MWRIAVAVYTGSVRKLQKAVMKTIESRKVAMVQRYFRITIQESRRFAASSSGKRPSLASVGGRGWEVAR